MHKHKKVLTSALALLLCFLTVFSCAFAYTEQQATSGYPQPPTYKGGNNSGNSFTSYTDPVIVGYRFTCWRSTDLETAIKNGTANASNYNDLLKGHNEAGYKLGHSINIMCNTVTSDGGSRTDYANGYSQTGLKMPHMLTNGEQDDFLDKISLAQSEQKSDANEPNKITHSTATDLMLMDYSGSNNGKLTSVEDSSYIEFYEPLYAEIDKPQAETTVLSDTLASAAGNTPVVVYSGYYSYDCWAEDLLNIIA